MLFAIDVIGPGDDTFFKAAEIVAPGTIAAVGVEVVRPADKFVRAGFTGVDYVDVAVGPGHLAIAPEALGVVEGDGAFRFAKITSAQEQQYA